MPQRRNIAATKPVAPWIVAALVATLLMSCIPTARGALLSLWQLDETSGTTAANSITGGFDGTLNGGPLWTWDGRQGQVLWVDGGDDYVNAGGIPPINTGDDFSVAFWARSEQGASNNVVLGNRYGGANNSWGKFTTRAFEWHPNNTNNHVDYADIPENQWIHHAVVKDGAAMTYYRDGVASGTATATVDMPQLPFYMGGDAGGERWRGRLNDVALFDQTLTPAEIQTIAGGDFSAFGVAYTPTPKETAMIDTFDGSAVDPAKWRVIDKGLESFVDGGYNAPTVVAGTLTIDGTTSHSYWAGKTLASQAAFDVPVDGEVRFDVDRVSLSGSGTARRSSMWMYQDQDHFLHFAQNIGESGWQYNAANQSPTGGGVNLSRADSLDGDGGNHPMALVHDGSFVKMFVDGRWVGSQAANFDGDFHVLLSAQGRQAGDTVSAVFDNAAVSTRTYTGLYDDFNSGSIDPAKWNVIQKGLENEGSFSGNLAAAVQDGELVFQGNTGSQYWYGVTLKSVETFAVEGGRMFSVDRDALDRGGASAVRSSVWLWADDEHWLMFGQNLGENGWQYNYRDGGSGPGSGGGVNIGAFDALDGDGGTHEMMLVFHAEDDGLTIDMLLDGQLGATQQFDNWGDLDYHLMLSGMPRASGDTVLAAFDNVQMWTVPEPGTVTLLALGIVGLLCFVRRRPTR
ncbi:MAG: PEP-CTERM sorting domain-containing protein [Planctomycetes bacterium]|nr:PEP-CTERM sorting domain-containing protein [Planctomycetota bacterium]